MALALKRTWLQARFQGLGVELCFQNLHTAQGPQMIDLRKIYTVRDDAQTAAQCALYPVIEQSSLLVCLTGR